MFSATLPSDPPARPAVRPQRSRGRIAVGFGPRGLIRLRQEGCGRCLFPDPLGGRAQAVVVNTAGGLTGGDRFAIDVSLAQDARLVVTTQAAERIYRSAGGRAELANRVSLAPGAALDWLPQETILFERAAMARRLDVDLGADARFLGLETLVLGRRAMGEDILNADVTDNWRIRRGGRLVHAEALRLRGDIAALSARAPLLGGARALATLVLVAPEAEAMLAAARAALPRDSVRAAASAWDGRLVVRWMAHDLMPLKAAVSRFLATFPGADVPRVWQI